MAARTDTMTIGADGPGGEQPLGRGRSAQRSDDGVTHRSPSGEDMQLPCCGRALSEVRGQDRLTTDPAQVTCGG